MSDLVTTEYTASFSGAIIRTGADKVSDIVSVRDFGAKGDGLTNDTAAFLAAAATNRAIYVPGGIYIISSTISVTGRAFSIHGDGPEASALIFQDCDGFAITHDPNGHPLKCSTIRDLSFKTTTDGTRKALRLTGSTSPYAKGKQFCVENCHFSGMVQATAWSRAVEMSSAAYTEINGCYFLGNTSAENSQYEKMDSAIYLKNISTDVRITNNTVEYAKYAILIDGDPNGLNGAFSNAGEGVVIICNHFVLVTIGVRSQRNSGNYIVVQNNHIAAMKRGVWIGSPVVNIGNINQVGSNNSQINHNFIFKRSDSQFDFIGIHIEADQCSVIGNETRSEAVSGNPGTEHMIVVSGKYNRIIGNHVDVADSAGIWVQSGSMYNIVVGNTGASISSGNKLLNQGASTVSSLNLFDVWDNTRTSLLHKTSDTGIGSGWNTVAWNVPVRDIEGHWDGGGRFNIFSPGRVKLEAMVIFSSNGNAAMHTAKIVKNGVNYYGVGAQSVYGSGPTVYVTSAEIDVQAGDYFEVIATQGTGGSVYATGYSWFQMKIVN